MMRMMLVLTGVASTAIVAFAVTAAGTLWFQGKIDRETVRDIRSAVFEDQKDVLEIADETDVVDPSSADVMRDRSTRILQLNFREGELARLEQWLDEKANTLSKSQQTFEQNVGIFDKRLAELDATITSQALVEARGILLAMSPEDAVEMLMEADLEQNILLVKGMPENKISIILAEFLSEEVERAPQELLARQKRAHEIFEMISNGDPHRKLIENVQQQAAANDSPPR